MSAWIRPPSLRPGDTIAIVPTARAITLGELREGIALAESWGLRVKLGAGVGRRAFQQAGSIAERTADLQAAINDPNVRAIWCARGGYGTVQLMERLDLSPLREDPKWMVGFSDITVLHNALHRLGLCSLHAQMPFKLAAKSEGSRDTLRDALFGRSYDVVHDRPIEDDHPVMAAYRTGTCEGTLIGGNLSLLYALRGTPYDLDPTGKILFLEDVDELLYHVDRMVMNLKLAGWFKRLAGLVIGGMTDMHDKDVSDPFGENAEQIIVHALRGTSYPFCSFFPTGHLFDNRALVLGLTTKLSVTTEGATLSFAGDLAA